MEGAARVWNTVGPVMTTQDAILPEINRYMKINSSFESTYRKMHYLMEL